MTLVPFLSRNSQSKVTWHSGRRGLDVQPRLRAIRVIAAQSQHMRTRPSTMRLRALRLGRDCPIAASFIARHSPQHGHQCEANQSKCDKVPVRIMSRLELSRQSTLCDFAEANG
jgi:hypothetical protein